MKTTKTEIEEMISEVKVEMREAFFEGDGWRVDNLHTDLALLRQDLREAEAEAEAAAEAEAEAEAAAEAAAQ